MSLESGNEHSFFVSLDCNTPMYHKGKLGWERVAQETGYTVRAVDFWSEVKRWEYWDSQVCKGKHKLNFGMNSEFYFMNWIFQKKFDFKLVWW